ncbi:MAG: NADH-quinone oxidoreductase subunit J [Myxococcota bacterium]
MSSSSFLLFSVCAFVALVGAVGTVAARRPLRAAMALLAHIIALAGLYLTLHAELLAAIQLLVYAGAIVVLFVFVIMLIGPASETEGSGKAGMIRMTSLVLMGMVTATIAFAIADVDPTHPRLPEGYGGVEAVGGALYTQGLVPFETISITLLVAIIGAVAVARGKTAVEKRIDAREKAEREAAPAPAE